MSSASAISPAGLPAAAAALAYVRATQGDRARPPRALAAAATGRLHDARRDRGAHARAAGGQRRHRRATRSSASSTRRSRRWARACCGSGCCSRCSTPARSAPARMRSPRWSTRPRRAPALRRLLKPVGDLARLTSRATLGVAHARDLVGLRALPGPAGRRARGDGRRWRHRSWPRRATALADLDDLRRPCSQAALVDEPPLTLQDGGIIRESWSDGAAARSSSDAAEARALDRRARGARARAHRAVEPARALQPRLRLRHRGHARAGRRGSPPSTCAARR